MLDAAPVPGAPPGRRSVAELVADVALALTLAGGALHQGARAWAAGEGTLGLAAALAPSVVAGALVAVRDPARGAGPREVLAALPSLALPLSMPLWVAPPGTWPTPHVVAFAVGALITCWALATLGRSFAVLPAPRRVVAAGPYRLVRHPAYAGELVMWAAACATLRWPVAVPLALAGAAALVVRIRAEERVLGADPAYRAYAATVRGRLVPSPGGALRSGG